MITIFTPTFNRADKVHRVWDSIQSQTYRNFEWVVIDDGSKDNIRSKIESYRKEADFPIQFHQFKENKGKHNATNKALEMAKGEFFMVADSDDAFTPDAIEFFMDGWNAIPLDQRDDFCGIRACCVDQFGNRVSDTLTNVPLAASMAEVYYKHGFRRESWCMVRTDWHRKFLFDSTHKGYYPEGIIWKAMSREKKLMFYNKPTRIYYVAEDPNSIMNIAKPPKEKASRNLIQTLDTLNHDMSYFWDYPKWFFQMAVLQGYYSLVTHTFWENFRKISTLSGKLLILAFFPISLMYSIIKR
ncbi:MAG: glycosyltransferase family 2 protein [Saprospiraceae bacterium]